MGRVGHRWIVIVFFGVCLVLFGSTPIWRYTRELDAQTGNLITSRVICGLSVVVKSEPTGLSRFLESRSMEPGRILLSHRPVIGAWWSVPRARGYEAAIAILSAELEQNRKPPEVTRATAKSFIAALLRRDRNEAERIVNAEVAYDEGK